jgi:hypothetical protein
VYTEQGIALLFGAVQYWATMVQTAQSCARQHKEVRCGATQWSNGKRAIVTGDVVIGGVTDDVVIRGVTDDVVIGGVTGDVVIGGEATNDGVIGGSVTEMSTWVAWDCPHSHALRGQNRRLCGA